LHWLHTVAKFVCLWTHPESRAPGLHVALRSALTFYPHVEGACSVTSHALSII
jgi:hypothetical protein